MRKIYAYGIVGMVLACIILIIITSFTLVIVGEQSDTDFELSAAKDARVIIPLPDNVKINWSKLNESGIAYAYMIPETVEHIDGKPPATPDILALTYECAPNLRVFIGYREKWIVFEALSDIVQKEVVLGELRHLVESEVVNLEEKDLNEIMDVLNSAIEWEFGIEIAYTDKWQQVFPKTVPSALTTLQNSKIYQPTAVPTATEIPSPTKPTPGYEAIFVVIGLLAAYLYLRGDKH